MAITLRTLSTVGNLAGALRAGRSGRNAYMALTLALTVGVWCLLSAFASQFISSSDPRVAGQEIAVNNARRLGLLPVAYSRRIASLQGVRSVYYMDLAVFDCASDSVTVNAIGGSGVEALLAREGFSQTQIDAWKRDRLGVLINTDTAKQCGWRAGMGIAPKTMSGNGGIEFHITAVASNSDGAGGVFGHYDYLNGQSAGVAGIGQAAGLYAQTIDPRSNEEIAARIEAQFAHDSPTVAAVTNTVNQNAWLRVGKVQYLLAFVMLAVFSCCALVLISILIHNVSESRGKFGLLQAIGFTRVQLWSAQFVQVCCILLGGTAGGIGAGCTAIKLLRPALGTFFDHITPPSWAWTWLLFGLAVLLVSIMLPVSMILARVRPADCREL